MSQSALRVSTLMLLPIPCHSALEAACEGTRWCHGFNTPCIRQDSFCWMWLQAKHGSNKTALAKEQVRAYEAK
jgi:hypothetical protein